MLEILVHVLVKLSNKKTFLLKATSPGPEVTYTTGATVAPDATTTRAQRESRFNVDLYLSRLPWSCDFGRDMRRPVTCGFLQDKTTDDFNWDPNVNATETLFTGPPASHFRRQGTPYGHL